MFLIRNIPNYFLTQLSQVILIWLAVSAMKLVGKKKTCTFSFFLPNGSLYFKTPGAVAQTSADQIKEMSRNCIEEIEKKVKTQRVPNIKEQQSTGL